MPTPLTLSLKCPHHCGKFFYRKSDLTKHVRFHHKFPKANHSVKQLQTSYLKHNVSAISKRRTLPLKNNNAKSIRNIDNRGQDNHKRDKVANDNSGNDDGNNNSNNYVNNSLAVTKKSISIGTIETMFLGNSKLKLVRETSISPDVNNVDTNTQGTEKGKISITHTPISTDVPTILTIGTKKELGSPVPKKANEHETSSKSEFKCFFMNCGKSFSRKSDYTKHYMRWHAMMKEKPVDSPSQSTTEERNTPENNNNLRENVLPSLMPPEVLKRDKIPKSLLTLPMTSSKSEILQSKLFGHKMSNLDPMSLKKLLQEEKLSQGDKQLKKEMEEEISIPYKERTQEERPCSEKTPMSEEKVDMISCTFGHCKKKFLRKCDYSKHVTNWHPFENNGGAPLYSARRQSEDGNSGREIVQSSGKINISNNPNDILVSKEQSENGISEGFQPRSNRKNKSSLSYTAAAIDKITAKLSATLATSISNGNHK
eukprot:Awhi_evm2s8364